ncbi:MAG: hypothetical protein L0H74_02695 [Brachybacterium sp.]|nr:hypothetical protein [Brachybacterium sp.]
MIPATSPNHLATLRSLHHPECTCDQDTLDATWKADLCLILHSADHAVARKLLDDFLATHEESITKVISRAQRIARLDPRDRETAMSYFGEALMKMIDTRWRAREGNGTSQVFNYSRNLPTILESETRACLREDRRKGLLNGTSGVPGRNAHDRRDSLVQRSRQLFELEHQQTPSDDELVAFHNERMLATRKDAARQSVLVTKGDLRPVSSVPLDDPDVLVDTSLSTVDEPDAGAAERARIIDSVIANCEQMDLDRERKRGRRLRRKPVQAAEVARLYFARHLEGIFPTRSELVEQLGITEPAARRELPAQLERVLAVARAEITDYIREH